MCAARGVAVRARFELSTKLEKWYPRHMNRGYREMMQTLRKVDCIVEVHDSRIPLSGRNTHFIRSLSSLKPHVIVMNKSDLMDIRYQNKIKERLESDDSNSRCIFVNSLDPSVKSSGFSAILPLTINMVRNSNRFNREDFNGYNLMIIGIPNVGKSTIINKLRNINLKASGKATTVGAIAGVTRSVLERIKINANPPVYLYDTPGVLEPKVDKGLETTMRCALCGTLSHQLISYEITADYLLYWLNRRNNYIYVDFLGLDGPSDNIKEVLIKGSVYFNNFIDYKSQESGELIKRPDMEKTAKELIIAFRKGRLGRFLLDDDLFS